MARNILGLAKLERKLRALPDAVKAELRAAVAASCTEIVNMAKSLVAVDDGKLRDSIGWTWGKVPKGAMTLGKVAASKLATDLTATIFAGNSEAFYARWVEFGTAGRINGGQFAGTQHPGTAAQPFFYPSYRASKKSAKARIRRAQRSAAKKVASS